MSLLTIGEAARRTGFTTSQLRYYDEQGLIPVQRSPAGYRLYDDNTLELLTFVGTAKKMGCTLDEIADLTERWRSQPCETVRLRLRQIVQRKIEEGAVRRRELDQWMLGLNDLAGRLDRSDGTGDCGPDCPCVGFGPPGGAFRDSSNDGGSPEGGSAAAVGCTLAHDAARDRLAAWRHILGYVTDQTEADTDDRHGVRLRFNSDVPLSELALLLDAESQCCTFFDFTLMIKDGRVDLEVGAPPEAAEILDAVFHQR